MGDSDAARLDAISTAPVASSPPGAGREERLVVAAVAGDAAAFAAHYDLHLERVYRYCYYRTGNRPDAEDLAQQTFLLAWRAIRRAVTPLQVSEVGLVRSRVTRTHSPGWVPGCDRLHYAGSRTVPWSQVPAAGIEEQGVHGCANT